MGAVGVPLLGEGVLSTWEIPVDEIVSSGTDRIIVYEGAEEKLNQLSSGLLEKLGVGGSSWEEREANRYTANLVPVENQLLSGSESEEQNNFMEEIKEDEFIEEEDYEEDYDEELEYVEIETAKEKINNKKQLYFDNDSSEQLENQIYEENTTEFVVKKPSMSNRASKRPIQRSQEPLDIEPVEEKKIVIENPQSESVEIDDPW